MARYALLVGSPCGGLVAPVTDVERIAGHLELRGFQIRRCVNQDATREGILAAYRSLIGAVGTADAVVIYYSGHGARSLDEEYAPPDEHAPEKRYHHFIVPMDLEESSDDDFRGILSLELSSLLGQLTAKTRNVSVIFDCCHAGGMSRDFRLRLKSLSKDWFTGASRHLERLRDGDIADFPLDQVAVQGNPHAVRLMAALPSQQAWEYDGPQGAYGLMTQALVTALEENEDRPVIWSAITRRVRELVQQSEPGQYPDVEGPGSRFVFDVREADLTGIVPVESTQDGPRLLGGRLLGIEVGDEYVIMPTGFQKIDPKHAIASATVTLVGGAWSLVALEPNRTASDLPEGAQAFPISRTHHTRAVVVEAGAEFKWIMEAAIAASGFLRLPFEDETKASPDILAVVEERDAQIHIREQADLDLITSLPASPDVVSTVVETLSRLARARKLETLETGNELYALRADYELDWGRVVGGSPTPLQTSGAILFVGDRIFVRVRNKSSSTLYVSLFNIGLTGNITLLNRNLAPSGVELLPEGAPFSLGYRESLGWKGIGPIYWPENVPNDGLPRAESLVVIIADRPQDLRALESPDMVAPKGAESERTELERLADQLATGRARDLREDNPPPEVRYAVEQIRWLLDPTESAIHVVGHASVGGPITRSSVQSETVPAPAVQDATGFLIDERPDPSAAYRRPRGVRRPVAVAVQLGEIVVHSNRALFGSTDVRVDALVFTGGDMVDGTYRAGTEKFDHVRDGDRLPLDNLMIYHGPVTGFLDLAVWVSRDARESMRLADMLEEQVNATEFKDAALVLAGLAVVAPTAGAIVAGMGAATTVANVAYKLLSAVAGTSIGLYRTSLLANEQFGVGRHPAHGLMSAQDFSFWYKVTEVE